MKIKMIGLNYRRAPLEVREKFVIPKEKIAKIRDCFCTLPMISGSVVISTCNRTEIYVSSSSSEISGILAKTLCDFLEVDFEKFRSYFFTKDDSETFEHLCKVAAGMDSQILGDDQIITQVREAVENARMFQMTDSYLETFFRTAIQAGKEIKTDLVISSPLKSSAPYQAVKKLRKIGSLKGKLIVVIGNGIMGRMTAELLVKEQAEVLMTLREYRKGPVEIPKGVRTVGYKNRYEAVAKADVVISATTSPHYTLHYADFLELSKFPATMIDLAVPRDVEPKIAELGEISIFTIDEICDQSNQLSMDILALARQIIEKNKKKYDHWYSFKERMLIQAK